MLEKIRSVLHPNLVVTAPGRNQPATVSEKNGETTQLWTIEDTGVIRSGSYPDCVLAALCDDPASVVVVVSEGNATPELSEWGFVGPGHIQLKSGGLRLTLIGDINGGTLDVQNPDGTGSQEWAREN